jgi:hypothetical protein
MFGVGSTGGEGGDGYGNYFRADADLDPAHLITPGSDKFYRSEIASGAAGWKTNPLRLCVDKASFIGYSLEHANLDAVQANLSTSLGMYGWLLPDDPGSFGYSSEFANSVIQPYVGLPGVNVHVNWSSPTSHYTIYSIQYESDLDVILAWVLIVQGDSLGGSSISRSYVDPRIGAPSDSHSDQYVVSDSLKTGACQPISTGDS